MTQTPTTGPLGTRAELRARRRKNRRRLTVVALLVLLGLLLTITAVLVSSGGSSVPTKKAPVRTQRTLLLQVQGTDGTAVISALMAHDPATKAGAVVLIPPQVLTQIPGTGNLPFGRALQTGQVAGARNGLSDLMGVIVDGSWVLDAPTFVTLVDRIGGIQATVDVPVVQGRTVVLSAGGQRLSGVQALTFATYLAPTEQEQSRLARLQNVLDGIVQALPKNLAVLLGSLGPGSQVSGTDLRGLQALLTGIRDDDAEQNLQYRSLPVIKVDAGTDEIRFRIDTQADLALVDELLAQSIPPGARATGNRVLVLNGVGTPGLGEKVRAKLVPAGFVYLGARNAPSFGCQQSEILVKDATVDGATLGERVAKALRLPMSSVHTSDQIGTIADVVVLTCRDFVASLAGR